MMRWRRGIVLGIAMTILVAVTLVAANGRRGHRRDKHNRGLRGLPAAIASEIWDQAVRAYPNGIPAGAQQAAIYRLLATQPAGNRLNRGSVDLIGGATWFPIGPAPTDTTWFMGSAGRATTIVVNPADSNDLWLGTAQGGVWNGSAASPGNANWQPAGDTELPSLAVGALAVDCCVGGKPVVWLGTGEDAIRRDTYYGAGVFVHPGGGGEFPTFWRQTGGGNPPNFFTYGSIAALVLDPATTIGRKILYAAVTSGVTASQTESTNFAPTPASGFGIFKYSEDTDTWTALSVPGTGGARPSDLKIDPVDGTLYAGFEHHGFFKSPAGGMAWAAFNAGIMNADVSNGDYPTLALKHVPAGSPILYGALGGPCPPFTGGGGAGSCNGGFGCQPVIYKLNNGNSHWNQVEAPGQDLCAYLSYTHALTVIDDSTVFHGGVRLNKSTDGGSTWNPSDQGELVHLDHHQVTPVFDGSGALVSLYDVNDGGIYSSTNGGASWTSLNTGLQTMALQSISSSGNVIFIGAQDNGTQAFQNTRVWQFVFDADASSTLVDVDDATRTYAVTQSSNPIARHGTSFQSTAGVSGPRAFYPIMVQDKVPSHAAPHPLYFGTNRVFTATQTGGATLTFSALSPVLGSASTFPQIDDSPDVLTAIGVGPSHLYAGLYSGDVYVATSPYTTWTLIGGPDFGGSPTPSRVVTSIAADADDGTGYVTLSGFGGPHVFKTTPSGAWTNINGAVPDVPCNAIAIEESGGAKALWLATDIGIFRRPVDLSTEWTLEGGGGSGANALPNVPVYALSIDTAHNRIYAGTHGRGVWVLTKPFVSNLEGWVNGSIWDIPVYGTGFVQVPGQTCTMTIINADASICGADTVDVMGGTIGIDPGGALITSQGSIYGGKQVVWACFNGHCLHGADITTCNPSTIKVDCTGNVTGVGTVAGCTPLGDPPSVTLNLGDPAPAAAKARTATAAPSFSVLATIQDGMSVGMTRTLCAASVSFQLSEDNDVVMARAASALNANPECLAQGVTAGTQSKSIPGPEDEIPQPQRLLLHAPSLSGTELVPAIETSPGSATGVCFHLDEFGVPATSALLLPRVRLIAGSGGAAGGGKISLQEISAVGSCTVEVATSPGETAEAMAADFVTRFHTQGIPGPIDCPSVENPADVTQDGGSLIFITARSLVICVDDANVGFTLAPEELSVTLPPDCSAAAAAPTLLWPPNHGLTNVAITGVTDPIGLPLMLEVTAVRQDEPVSPPSRGEVAGPDAVVPPGPVPPGVAAVQLRSERLGGGDGRVYHIAFTATNSEGGQCAATVNVCVPHDQAHLHCGDQGALFDSTRSF